MEQPNRPRPSPVDVVFGIGDLLDEILIRLEFPRFLIPALQVNKFWSSRATNLAFRRDFLERLASRPRPLGFYLDTIDQFDGSTKFVPMSQRPELAALLSPAVKFGMFDDEPLPGESAIALDCRNGRVLLSQYHYEDGPYLVLDPLRQPLVMLALPPLQPPLASGSGLLLRFLTGRCCNQLCIFINISWLPLEQGALVRLCLLEGFAWVDRTSHATGLSAQIDYNMDALLNGNKLYMLYSDGCIVRLDLDSMRFFVIQLPDDIKSITMNIQSHLLSRADDSSVYLIEVSGTQLSVWLCKTHGDDPVSWVKEDTFCLYEAFGDFASEIWTMEDKIYSCNSTHLFGAGDNAEFVFLVHIDGDTHNHIFYLNIRSRKVEKVYARNLEEGHLIGLCPFMRI